MGGSGERFGGGERVLLGLEREGSGFVWVEEEGDWGGEVGRRVKLGLWGCPWRDRDAGNPCERERERELRSWIWE